MNLAVIGWAVVHSLWQCTFIAGLTAMMLGLLRDSQALRPNAMEDARRGQQARVRYLIGCLSLAIMALTVLLTAVTGNTSIGSRVRHQMLISIDGAIDVPAIVFWGSLIVPAAAVVWLAGLVVCLIHIGVQWRRARALRHGDLEDAGAAVRAVVADLRARMSLRAAVDVRCSTRAAVPMVLGWRRPLILLPPGITTGLTPSQLRAVLTHELAHVRRRDHLANLLQIVAETLLFHHPAARWVSRRIRAEREYCCDDIAVAIGRDVGGYARALAALEDARSECRLVVAAASGTLLDRIQRIAGHPRRMLTPARGAIALVIACVLAAAMLAITMTVPPSVPPGAQVRRRVPPPGRVLPPPGDQRLPRTR